jgi:hypothetical protein
MRQVIALLLLAGFALAANVTVSAPVTNVTLYSNGFSFVQRGGEVALPGGEATLHIVNFSTSALASSITPSLSSGQARQFYPYYYNYNESRNETQYFSIERLLNDSVGKTVSFVSGNDSVSGTLSWHGEGMLGVSAQGGISVYRVSELRQLTLPVSQASSVVQVNESKSERGLAVVATGSGSSRLSVSYISSGTGWQASYRYRISSESASGSGTMRGYATIDNGAGEDWKDVNLRLVVGSPRIQQSSPFYYPYPSYAKTVSADAAGAAPAESTFNQFTPQVVSAYYVYTLDVPATVLAGEERSIPLLENQIGFKRELFWDSSYESPQKVFILNNTGGESWASGPVAVYLGDEFIGQGMADYTPRGQEARIVVSDMPDLKAKKEILNQTSTTTSNSRTTRYSVKLTIQNAAGEDATLRINDQMYYGDEVRLVSSSLPATEKPGRVLEWNPTVQQGKTLEITFEYTVTNYYTDIRPY